ncbi:Putative cation/proton antiporter YbaL [Anaerolineae bacterium]|nr:Putative cation/proton antiporter YbaL [Anaerolineae bacterium]
MHNTNLLTNITIALLTAFAGGAFARRLKLPTIVGYLLAGVAIGPFTPGFVGDVEAISQLAELGVIFLMFGVGLHFSLHDLWVVRDIAIPGAILQMTLATALGFIVAQVWGWSLSASLLFGLAISIASTVVLLRQLMNEGLLNSVHGRVAVGWLIVEDIATVFILVVMRAFAPENQESFWLTTAITLTKSIAFIILMLLVGARFVPWLLSRMASTGSRELFILTVIVVALGTAFGAAELFGVSLALGAFVAGVMVSESTISYQVGADVLPFREIFAVLFFVSVGMLVNPFYLLDNALMVVMTTLLIIVAKPIIAASIGFLFPYPARTAIVVAAGLSQIGEFSFLLGTSGLELHLIERDQYSLILAGAVLSILVNPLVFRGMPYVEAFLQRFPTLWKRLDHHGPAALPPTEQLKEHVVVVGYGRVGHHIVHILEYLNIPRLVIEAESSRITELERAGTPTLFGDAANTEVIAHAGLERAKALVITLPDEAAAEVVVALARKIAPDLPIIARASTRDGVTRLAELGAQDVIHPELEGGLEIVRYTLLRLKMPPQEVQKYTEMVRRDHYDAILDAPEEYQVLDQMISAARGMQIAWHTLDASSHVIGRTVAGAHLRDTTGASVIAIIRNQQLIANPKSALEFEAGEIVGIIGDDVQVNAAESLLSKST